MKSTLTQPIIVRRKSDRGATRLQWLESYHTFSFGDYYDPENRGFSVLRVINDDVVQPNKGFGLHHHDNMEIITYVLTGSLQHQDTLGHVMVMSPGEVQRMSAGTGIEHSEWNTSPDQAVHLLQIWIYPERKGLPPSYEHKRVVIPDLKDQWQVLASPDLRDNSVLIHQDAVVSTAQFTPGGQVTNTVEKDRQAWLHVATGQVEVNGLSLEAGDALGFGPQSHFHILALTGDAETMLFDLPVLAQ